MLSRDRPNSRFHCVLHALAPYQTRSICFCGIARIHVSVVFYTYWANIKLAASLCGIARFCVSFVFCTYWGNIKVAICFCRSARIHVLDCALHMSGQYQTSVLLWWDRPNSCCLLCFTHIVQYRTSDLLLQDGPNLCLLLCFTRIGAISN